MAPRLTACMIVRDEIDCLEACLDSLAPWVDEIAIVDTGSKDGTWELVQVRAHRFAQIEWPDHFADARNASLALATGDWILVVDADERICSGGDELRRAIQDAALLAAEITIVNELGDGNEGEFSAVRLFRRHERLAYSGRIHEQVADSIQALMCDEPAWRTAKIALTLRHDGYVPERFEAKGKAERNVRLLERSVAELGDDAAMSQRVYLEYKLSTALGAGPTGQVWLLRAARRLLDAPEAECAKVPLSAEILISAAQCWLRGGEAETALEAANRAGGLARRHPMVGLVRGQAFLAMGDLQQAQRCFEVETQGASGGFYFDEEGLAIALAVGRAEIFHRQHDHDGALAALDSAKARMPNSRQLTVARLHALIKSGKAEQGLREGVQYMKNNPQDRNGLLVCAAAADALGMVDRAAKWRAMAMG